MGELHILRPTTDVRDPEDLAVLRSLLDRWGVAEETRIRETVEEDDSRIAAQTRRLEQEIEILRAIEVSRNKITRRRAERARAKFLDELSMPIDLEGDNHVDK